MESPPLVASQMYVAPAQDTKKSKKQQKGSSSKSAPSDSFLFYPSPDNQEDNQKCALVSSLFGISLTTDLSAPVLPFRPLLVHNNNSLFGANHICRYVLHCHN